MSPPPDLLPDENTALVGSLASVRFTSEQGDFCVARLQTQRGEVTVVGDLCGAVEGEHLQLKGRWESDRKYGRQFRVGDCVVIPPTTQEGIVRYLSSGLIDGIGPVLAKRLVAAFGERTLDVIEVDSSRLREVPGIGKVRLKRIVNAWERQRAIRQVMLFLSSHRVSTTFAYRIYEVYGDRAIQIVRDEPYQLARDVHGIGFVGADRIALEQGLSKSSSERLTAGLTWTLEEAAKSGHVFLSRNELEERAMEILDVDRPPLEAAVEVALEEKWLVEEVIGASRESAIYTRAAHAVERELAERVARLAGQGTKEELRKKVLSRMPAVRRRLGIELEAGQRQASEQLAGARLAILTGGPGTGKTTLVKLIADSAKACGQKVLLAAPTGRAARRLSQATGMQAETIHRALQFSFAERRFTRDEARPLEADLVVIDESSMLDQYLARALFRAIPSGSSLLLVGDADQLPSVGAGNVLQDLLSVPELASARLTEVFRQAHQSDIIVNAHRICGGLMPERRQKADEQLGDFYHINVEDAEQAQQRVLTLVCDRIPAAFGFDPIDDVQVLAPMHKGACGITELNQLLQEKLNPRGESVHCGGRVFRVGDKVLQLRNDYQKKVFNGEIGKIISFNKDSAELTVSFDGQNVIYHRAEMHAVALAYCISIHKSQGSEYPAVVVPLTTQHYIMLQRNLLYTAVTRAQRLVCVVGQPTALGRAVKNAAPRKRNTLLASHVRRLMVAD